MKELLSIFVIFAALICNSVAMADSPHACKDAATNYHAGEGGRVSESTFLHCMQREQSVERIQACKDAATSYYGSQGNRVSESTFLHCLN